MIGYIMQYQNLDGQGIRATKNASTVRKNLRDLKPLCYQLYYGQYYRMSDDSIKVVNVNKSVDVFTEFKYSNAVKNDRLIEVIGYLATADDKSFASVHRNLGLDYRECERIYYKFNEIRLLNKFDPMSTTFEDLDPMKVAMWQKYKLSSYWYLYQKSDCVKEKFEKAGVNYDELNDSVCSNGDDYE